MAWFLAFAGFCALIVLHELGHFAAAKAVGMRVERFALFFPPLIFKKKIGETEYGIGAIPLGGFVKISGMSPAEDLPEEVRDRAYHAQPIWKRIVVIAAGPVVNLVVAFLLLLLYFGAYGPRDATTNTIASVQAGNYPAKGVLHVDDKLVSVDGHKGNAVALGKLIAAHKCAGDSKVKGCHAATPATVVVNRDGKLVTAKLTPIYDPDALKTRIGVGYESDNRKVSFGTAFDITKNQYWYVTKQTVSLPAKLIHTKERKQLSGVVGTYEATRQSILNRPRDAIAILALISLSLAIVNLFPFLPLDGGHIFWAIVEGIRRRPVTLRTMERASVIGFMLVAVIFVIGFTNDIGRLSDGTLSQMR